MLAASSRRQDTDSELGDGDAGEGSGGQGDTGGGDAAEEMAFSEEGHEMAEQDEGLLEDPGSCRWLTLGVFIENNLHKKGKNTWRPLADWM